MRRPKALVTVLATIALTLAAPATAQAHEPHDDDTSQLFNLDSSHTVLYRYMVPTTDQYTAYLAPGEYTSPSVDVMHFYMKNCYRYYVTVKRFRSDGYLVDTIRYVEQGPANFILQHNSHAAISNIDKVC